LLTFLLSALLAAAPDTATRAESVSIAVMTFEPRGGVTADTAELLTDNVVAHVRRLGRYTRTVTSKELEASLGLEQQKQLMQCSSEGCIAELGGALDVTHMLTGTVGRLGSEYLLNLRLVVARTGVGAGSVSQRVAGTTEEPLLNAVEPAVTELLRQAGHLRPEAVVPAPQPAPPSTAAVGDASTASEPHRPWAWLGGAAGLAAAAVVSVLVALVAGGAAVAIRLIAPELPGAGQWVLVYGPAWVALGGLGAVLLVAALGLSASAAGLGAVGFINR
jgi:TolB-like protein